MLSRGLLSKLGVAGCCVIGGFSTLGPLVAMATSAPPRTPGVTDTSPTTTVAACPVGAPGLDGCIDGG